MMIFLPLAYFNTVSTFALRPAKAWQTKKDSLALRIMTWNVQSFVNYLYHEQT